MNLQTRYDMELQKDILGDRLEKEVVVLTQKEINLDKVYLSKNSLFLKKNT